MEDLTVVPWVYCWIGLALAVCGSVVTIWSVVRERFSVRGERVGLAILGVGAALVVMTLLFNGSVLIATACVDGVRSPKTYESPD